MISVFWRDRVDLWLPEDFLELFLLDMVTIAADKDAERMRVYRCKATWVIRIVGKESNELNV